MHHRHRSRSAPGQGAADRQGLWLLAGIFAIPFVTVTSAALVGDVASRTDGDEAGAALAGLVLGVTTAFLLAGLVRSATAGVQAWYAALRASCAVPGGWASRAVRSVPPRVASAPVVALVPVPVGRRGPPARR